MGREAASLSLSLSLKGKNMAAERRKYETKEEAAEARRAQIRAGVAAHKARMQSMSRLDQAAYRARAELGEGYDPYTVAERAEMERLRLLRDELEASCLSLNGRLVERLRVAAAEDVRLSGLLESLDGVVDRLNLAAI